MNYFKSHDVVKKQQIQGILAQKIYDEHTIFCQFSRC